jgi:hypothetical protein
VAPEQKTSKKFICAECKEVYVSPIPVLEVKHKCLKRVVAPAKRIGMVAQ